MDCADDVCSWLRGRSAAENGVPRSAIDRLPVGTVQLLRDCGQQKIKLDFIGLHYYGNISSLDGQYPANFPSFIVMLADTRRARDRYCPGTPICMTEWGPSYHTDNSPTARVNANHIGAAWSPAFLNSGAQQFFGTTSVAVQAWLIGPAAGDAVGTFDCGKALTAANTAVHPLERITATAAPQGLLLVRYTLPRSSVCLVQLGEANDH